MQDKIKITLPLGIKEVLMRDCEDFRILKGDATPNMNAFINLLLVNYYEAFSAREESLCDKVREALSLLPKKTGAEIFNKLVGIVADRDSTTDDGAGTTLAFKPTKIAARAVAYIEEVLLGSEAMSSFYRRMFISYTRKPKDERERIIHKEAYTHLLRAIEKQVNVSITIEGGVVYQNVSVYAVATAKDEIYNYALLYADSKNYTIMLSKIKMVLLLSQPSYIPSENRALFDRQIKEGAQYPIYATDNEPIVVRLTPKGVALFSKIYLYRPTPISIDGDIYTFNCSRNQALYYFERFGENALILSPRKLGIFMRNYYYFALKKYRSIYGTKEN